MPSAAAACAARAAGHLADPHGGGDLAGGGPGDLLQLRQDVDGTAGRARGDRGGDGLQVPRVGAVDHDGQQRAAFGDEFLPGHLDGVDGLRDGSALGADDGDDRGGEVVRQPGVEVELDGGVLAGQVGALDDHDVAVPGHLGEDLHAAGVDFLALALGEEAADLGEGQPSAAAFVAEVEPGLHQRDHGVRGDVVAIDHGLEEADPVRVPVQGVRQPEGYERLPGARGGRADVDSFGHGSPFAVKWCCFPPSLLSLAGGRATAGLPGGCARSTLGCPAGIWPAAGRIPVRF